MWLWLRAIFYMIVVGGGWLVLLPAFILYLEAGLVDPTARAWPFQLAAGILFIAGFVLAIAAGYFLIGCGRGTPLPLDPPEQLVTRGPYQVVRNPQAIAMDLMVAGEVLLIQSRVLWIMLPLTLLYLELVVGPPEERWLRVRFGNEYSRYCARVPKWIPHWHRER